MEGQNGEMQEGRGRAEMGQSPIYNIAKSSLITRQGRVRKGAG